MAVKPAPSEAPTPPHRHWDKIVAYAYLRVLGHTQVEGARGVGRSKRAVQLWEADADLWRAARDEARERWLDEVTDAARRSVLKAAGRNADLGLKVLEKLDPAFAPPRQRFEHTGKDGGPVQTEDVSLSDAERAARVLALLDRARARRDGRAPDGE
jgi:hypothetical protein